MDKRTAAAKVNSSYTIFFLLSTICLTFIFSSSFGELNNRAWFVILGYALLIYFIWDLIKQLYSPGQSIILYCLTFSVLPFLLSKLLGSAYPIAGMVIWLLAMVIAGVIEAAYESIVKSITPKRIMERLFFVDGKIDKSMVNLNRKYESSFNIRSISLGILLMFTYCALSFVFVIKS